MKIIPIQKEWNRIRRHFHESRRSNSHFVLTVVDNEGYPRPIPIGSFMLNNEPSGFFFEQFTSSFARFGEVGQRVCVLAVNTNKWFWLKSILWGRFERPPAIRLYGRLGERRQATAEEKVRFQRLVQPVRQTKGYKLMWKDMNMVRELSFERAEGAMIGKMTASLWASFAAKETPERTLS
ncbi:MAG: hypothetical protein R2828_06960 [Saprospiraceae bacterium]